jgi:anti-sigma B factor antagonist
MDEARSFRFCKGKQQFSAILPESAPSFLIDSGDVRTYYQATPVEPSWSDSHERAQRSSPSRAFLNEHLDPERFMILQLQKSHPAKDICLIEFFGRLLMGNDSRQVEWTVGELLEAGVKKIIFELSKLDSIDSTGVGIIVMCEGKVRKAGGEVYIAGPVGLVYDTLLMTHVDRLIRFFPTAKEATEDFQVA